MPNELGHSTVGEEHDQCRDLGVWGRLDPKGGGI